MTLKSLKLKSSDLGVLQQASLEVVDKRAADILEELAHILQEGIAQQDDLLERTLFDWEMVPIPPLYQKDSDQ
jgi:hypothetical protein